MGMSAVFRGWDTKTLMNRLVPGGTDTRYAGGAPDPRETDCYRRCLLSFFPGGLGGKRVLVLGMTPELRRMALALGAATHCVDKNSGSIAAYGPLVDARLRKNETTVQCDWLDMASVVSAPFDAVLGDGVFGNLLSIRDHDRLLKVLEEITSRRRLLLFRKILMPEDVEAAGLTAAQLIGKYRSGLIFGEEFGFSMRLWGDSEASYDHATCILDNRVFFQRCSVWRRRNVITDEEYTWVMRYFYDGLNMVLPREKWERVLADAGLRFERRVLEGRIWYRYYPVYACC